MTLRWSQQASSGRALSDSDGDCPTRPASRGGRSCPGEASWENRPLSTIGPSLPMSAHLRLCPVRPARPPTSVPLAGTSGPSHSASSYIAGQGVSLGTHTPPFQSPVLQRRRRPPAEPTARSLAWVHPQLSLRAGGAHWQAAECRGLGEWGAARARSWFRRATAPANIGQFLIHKYAPLPPEGSWHGVVSRSSFLGSALRSKKQP